MNHSNKDGKPLAESEEGRPLIKENVPQPYTDPTQSGVRVSQGLAGVRKAAKGNKKMQFTALLHHVTVDLLRASFLGLKRSAAAGVDGITWQEYEHELEAQLIKLHARVHRGAYRAQPSRRVYIPKADGRQRPLGVAALEDKIVQHAVATILNQIYEEDFLGFSYGFRPRRHQHQALNALWVGLMEKKVNWVLDADIQAFFDNIDHGWMLKFVRHRVADSRILRLIQKWLKAGVMEDSKWSETKMGTPQGAVISPLLANIYLHYVFDLWVQKWRKQHFGEVIVVRYADDFVMGFQHRRFAEAFLQELRERLAKFGLKLHPHKTRLFEFGRFAAADRARRGDSKPKTFDFLGFTHISGKDQKGYFMVQRQSAKKRMRQKLKEIKQQLHLRIHEPPVQTGKWLRSVVQGFFNYHAIPGNIVALGVFRERATRLWRWTLMHRSQRAYFNWSRMHTLATTWLPPARILHSYPRESFYATHPR